MRPGRAPEIRRAAGEIRFIQLGTTRSERRLLPPLIVSLQQFCCRLILSSVVSFLGGGRHIEGTHRPATNMPPQPFDGFLKTFERDNALWSDNEYSDVVLRQDSTIRVSQDQSQRARIKEGNA